MKLTGKQALFLGGLTAAAVILLTIAALLAVGGQASTNAALPTAAVLPTLQSQRETQTAASAAATETTTPSPSDAATSVFSSSTPALAITAPETQTAPQEIALSASPLPITVVTQTAPQTAPSASPPPGQPTDPPPTTPQAAPVLTLFPTPEGLIALGQAVNIGGGELRVLQLHRPADTLLREMTGSLPPAPSGRRWVAVELLLICAGDTNCTPSPSSFTLFGASGGEYAVNRTAGLQPYFAPETYLIGQTWGYLLFAAPPTEAALWLALTTEVQTYLFGLG